MKSFKTHLAEAAGVPTICELMSDSSPDRLIDLYTAVGNGTGGYYDYTSSRKTSINKLYQSIAKALNQTFTPDKQVAYKQLIEYIFAMYSWFESQGGAKAPFMPKIVKMASCPGKAAWAGYSGKVYRGLFKSRDWIKGLKFTGEIVEKKDAFFAVANGVYKSKYAAQSWAKDFEVSMSFTSDQYGSSAGGIGVIMETNVTKQNTFLSPEISNTLGSYGEDEIIRVSNVPTPVKMYVQLDNFVEQEMQTINKDYLKKLENIDSEKEQIRLVTEYAEKRFATILGTTAAKQIANHPKFKTLLKKQGWL